MSVKVFPISGMTDAMVCSSGAAMFTQITAERQSWEHVDRVTGGGMQVWSRIVEDLFIVVARHSVRIAEMICDMRWVPESC